MTRIVFLNTTIITADGDYRCVSVPLESVRHLLADLRIERLSAIGHESTASVLSELLGEKIELNRIQYKQEKGDICICFKLSGRPPEGKIISADEIETIGYEFKIMTRID